MDQVGLKCSSLSAGTSRRGASSGTGARAPSGEGQERSGRPDQRHEREAGGGRADRSEGREEDHPEAGGEGAVAKRRDGLSPSAHMSEHPCHSARR